MDCVPGFNPPPDVWAAAGLLMEANNINDNTAQKSAGDLRVACMVHFLTRLNHSLLTNDPFNPSDSCENDFSYLAISS
jgi:hypothetical protein